MVSRELWEEFKGLRQVQKALDQKGWIAAVGMSESMWGFCADGIIMRLGGLSIYHIQLKWTGLRWRVTRLGCEKYRNSKTLLAQEGRTPKVERISTKHVSQKRKRTDASWILAAVMQIDDAGFASGLNAEDRCCAPERLRDACLAVINCQNAWKVCARAMSLAKSRGSSALGCVFPALSLSMAGGAVKYRSREMEEKGLCWGWCDFNSEEDPTGKRLGLDTPALMGLGDASFDLLEWLRWPDDVTESAVCSDAERLVYFMENWELQGAAAKAGIWDEESYIVWRKGKAATGTEAQIGDGMTTDLDLA